MIYLRRLIIRPLRTLTRKSPVFVSVVSQVLESVVGMRVFACGLLVSAQTCWSPGSSSFNLKLFCWKTFLKQSNWKNNWITRTIQNFQCKSTERQVEFLWGWNVKFHKRPSICLPVLHAIIIVPQTTNKRQKSPSSKHALIHKRQIPLEEATNTHAIILYNLIG